MNYDEVTVTEITVSFIWSSPPPCRLSADGDGGPAEWRQAGGASALCWLALIRFRVPGSRAAAASSFTYVVIRPLSLSQLLLLNLVHSEKVNWRSVLEIIMFLKVSWGKKKSMVDVFTF